MKKIRVYKIPVFLPHNDSTDELYLYYSNNVKVLIPKSLIKNYPDFFHVKPLRYCDAKEMFVISDIMKLYEKTHDSHTCQVIDEE